MTIVFGIFSVYGREAEYARTGCHPDFYITSQVFFENGKGVLISSNILRCHSIPVF